MLFLLHINVSPLLEILKRQIYFLKFKFSMSCKMVFIFNIIFQFTIILSYFDFEIILRFFIGVCLFVEQGIEFHLEEMDKL